MEPDKLFVNWPGYIIEGALWRGGLFNDTIFVNYLDKVLPKEGIYKKVTVGATDTKTGRFVRFTEDVGYQDMVYKAARASAAIPGVFEYVNYQNMTLVDGGVVINLDIGGAIDRCKEVVDDEKDIIIDIVMCSGDTLQPADASNFNSLQMFWRYYQINKYQKSMIWITQGLANFPRVTFRYLVAPRGSIDNSIIPIDFSRKNIERLIRIGQEDAQKTVGIGEGAMFEHVKNFWAQTATNPTYTETLQQYLDAVLEPEVDNLISV